eukprot:scpid19841/ scgid4304/ Uncharacterized protein C15orf33 homolog
MMTDINVIVREVAPSHTIGSIDEIPKRMREALDREEAASRYTNPVAFSRAASSLPRLNDDQKPISAIDKRRKYPPPHPKPCAWNKSGMCQDSHGLPMYLSPRLVYGESARLAKTSGGRKSSNEGSSNLAHTEVDTRLSQSALQISNNEEPSAISISTTSSANVLTDSRLAMDPSTGTLASPRGTLQELAASDRDGADAPKPWQKRPPAKPSEALLELEVYPGFDPAEPSQLPQNIDVLQHLRRITACQKDLRKKPRFRSEWEVFFYSDTSVTMFLDYFWWIFLQHFKNGRDRVTLGLIFSRVSDCYMELLRASDYLRFSDALHDRLPIYLAQAVYSAYTHAFPSAASYFNTDFKDLISSVLFTWVSGVTPIPYNWRSWPFDSLDSTSMQKFVSDKDRVEEEDKNRLTAAEEIQQVLEYLVDGTHPSGQLLGHSKVMPDKGKAEQLRARKRDLISSLPAMDSFRRRNRELRRSNECEQSDASVGGAKASRKTSHHKRSMTEPPHTLKPVHYKQAEESDVYLDETGDEQQRPRRMFLSSKGLPVSRSSHEEFLDSDDPEAQDHAVPEILIAGDTDEATETISDINLSVPVLTVTGRKNMLNEGWGKATQAAKHKSVPSLARVQTGPRRRPAARRSTRGSSRQPGTRTGTQEKTPQSLAYPPAQAPGAVFSQCLFKTHAYSPLVQHYMDRLGRSRGNKPQPCVRRTQLTKLPQNIPGTESYLSEADKIGQTMESNHRNLEQVVHGSEARHHQMLKNMEHDDEVMQRHIQRLLSQRDLVESITKMMKVETLMECHSTGMFYMQNPVRPSTRAIRRALKLDKPSGPVR